MFCLIVSSVMFVAGLFAEVVETVAFVVWYFLLVNMVSFIDLGMIVFLSPGLLPNLKDHTTADLFPNALPNPRNFGPL